MNSLLQFIKVNHFIGNNYLYCVQFVSAGAVLLPTQMTDTLMQGRAFASVHHTLTGSICLATPCTYSKHSPWYTIHLQETIASVHHTLAGSVGLG